MHCHGGAACTWRQRRVELQSRIRCVSAGHRIPVCEAASRLDYLQPREPRRSGGVRFAVPCAYTLRSVPGCARNRERERELAFRSRTRGVGRTGVPGVLIPAGRWCSTTGEAATRDASSRQSRTLRNGAHARVAACNESHSRHRKRDTRQLAQHATLQVACAARRTAPQTWNTDLDRQTRRLDRRDASKPGGGAGGDARVAAGGGGGAARWRAMGPGAGARSGASAVSSAGLCGAVRFDCTRSTEHRAQSNAMHKAVSTRHRVESHAQCNARYVRSKSEARDREDIGAWATTRSVVSTCDALPTRRRLCAVGRVV
eukprot:2375712-Rhodomonas_salina.3